MQADKEVQPHLTQETANERAQEYYSPVALPSLPATIFCLLLCETNSALIHVLGTALIEVSLVHCIICAILIKSLSTQKLFLMATYIRNYMVYADLCAHFCWVDSLKYWLRKNNSTNGKGTSFFYISLCALGAFCMLVSNLPSSWLVSEKLHPSAIFVGRDNPLSVYSTVDGSGLE